MDNKNLIPLLFITSSVLVITGTYLKISAITGGGSLMLLGVAAQFTFLFATIREISQSKRINSNSKTLWYIALIMASTIAGLFYILSARKDITNQNKLTQN
jgi:hypothetical protein